jgi:hypothetical protein
LQKNDLKKVIEGMVTQTLWFITFVHYLIEESEIPIGEEAQANYQKLENDLTLLVIVGIKVCYTLDK